MSNLALFVSHCYSSLMLSAPPSGGRSWEVCRVFWPRCGSVVRCWQSHHRQHVPRVRSNRCFLPCGWGQHPVPRADWWVPCWEWKTLPHYEFELALSLVYLSSFTWFLEDHQWTPHSVPYLKAAWTSCLDLTVIASCCVGWQEHHFTSVCLRCISFLHFLFWLDTGREAEKLSYITKYLKAVAMFRDYNDVSQDPDFSQVSHDVVIKLQ